MSEVLRNRGIAHHFDYWGLEGAHDWPRWHHQIEVGFDLIRQTPAPKNLDTSR